MANLDKETLKAISQNEGLASMVGSDGWKQAKNILYKRLAELDSISKVVLENKTPMQMMNEFQARMSVISIVDDWISEIEGSAVSHEELLEILEQEKESEYIKKM